MLEDLVKRGWLALAQFLGRSKELAPGKLSGQKPSLIVAVGKRRNANVREEYWRRFASPAYQVNHPSGVMLAGEQGLRKPPARQDTGSANQPKDGDKGEFRRFETRDHQRRGMPLKLKGNWSSRFSGGFTWSHLLLALLRSYHGVASIKLQKRGLIAVTMGFATALSGAYAYRTITADSRLYAKKLTYDRVGSGGSVSATALPAVPVIRELAGPPPNPSQDSRDAALLLETEQSRYKPETAQTVAAEREATAEAPAVQSLPDGTRPDVARPAPVSGIVSSDIEQLRSLFLAAAKPPVSPAGNPAPVAEPARAPENVYFVQVKSDQDQKAAQAELAAVVEKYKPILGEVALTTRSADLKEKGIWFRVLAGPVKSRDEAVSLCRKLKGAGLQDCLIQRID